MNFYDNEGKLEGKIIEVKDGYLVTFDGIIIGIYEKQQNARDAVMTQKRLKYKRIERENERVKTDEILLKTAAGGMISVLFIIVVIVIWYFLK